ncbi:MAG: beta-galactosidase, partial [Muribaculaceae bacterium]|nr:beta-galactosidase [Muribaculaceae bacterium]
NDAHRNGSGKLWLAAGLDSISQQVVSSKLKNNVLTIDTRIIGRDSRMIGTATFRYSVRPGKRLAVESVFTPDTAIIKSMPRVGLVYRTPASLASTVSYIGRSGETYVDRNTSGRIGRHSTTPAADFHNYIVPQATGNHTDVRSIDFNDGLLSVTSNRPFQFSATPYSDSNIQAAKHINDLVDDGMVTVHLDAEQTGVGTATCGPDILPKYRIAIVPTEFCFFFNLK